MKELRDPKSGRKRGADGAVINERALEALEEEALEAHAPRETKPRSTGGEAGVGRYDKSPLPLLLTWFGVPLLLIVVSMVLSDYLHC